MTHYPAINNMLKSLFSVEVGLEDATATAMLVRALNDPVYREIIEGELIALFADDALSWIEFLDNDEYAVYAADDEAEAKEYFKSLIWDRVFAKIGVRP